MPESQTIAPEEQAALDSTLKSYQAAGLEFAKEHPDYPETLALAEKRGLNLNANGDTAALREILRMGKRGHALIYYVTRKENFGAAHKLMSLKGQRAIEEVHRLRGLIDRIGFAVEYEPKQRDEDKYLDERRQDIRAGKRRR